MYYKDISASHFILWQSGVRFRRNSDAQARYISSPFFHCVHTTLTVNADCCVQSPNVHCDASLLDVHAAGGRVLLPPRAVLAERNLRHTADAGGRPRGHAVRPLVRRARLHAHHAEQPLHGRERHRCQEEGRREGEYFDPSCALSIDYRASPSHLFCASAFRSSLEQMLFALVCSIARRCQF